MPLPAHMLLLAGGASGPAFDPLSLAWAHAYWPEGPEFLALGLADSAAVGTFPDEIGTADLTQGTANRKPLYKTSVSGFSKPGLAFDATGGQQDSLGPVAYSTISPPHTVVLILYDNTTGQDHYYVDGKDSTHRRIIGALNTNVYRHYAGAAADGGTNVAGKKGVRSKIVSGTSDLLTINGSNITTATAGDQDMTGLTMNAAYDLTGAWGEIQVVFCGVYSGDVTGDGGWAGFVSWASSYYGVTIS